MFLKSTLSNIVQDQKRAMEKRSLGVKRELLNEIDLKSPHTIILSGIRRCGKSTLLHQVMKYFKKYYYFNFEDQRAFGFKLGDFEKLDEVFREEKGETRIYFFDEIQNVAGWERFVRSKQEEGNKFFITGSNASLLSRELGTKLTGRHLSYELFPFSYREMMRFKGLKPSLASFKKYYELGGFPEYLQYNNLELLQQLFKDILARDIVVRYGLRDEKTLHEIALYLITNIGREFSYNGLRKYFQLGSTNTAKSYVHYLEASYLLFTLPKFSYSLKQQLIHPKKVYAIDVQFGRANSATFSPEEGRILENIAFLALRRKYSEIFYFNEGKECDFLIKEKNKMTRAIQVYHTLNEDNKTRELGGLDLVMKKLSISNGIILTWNQEDQLGKIKVLPLWKWLCLE